MKKLLLILTFIAFSGYSQKISEKVLAKGVIYSWKIYEGIFKDVNGNRSLVYFVFDYKNGGYIDSEAGSERNGYIGLLERGELETLIAILKEFSNDNGNDIIIEYGACFNLKKVKEDIYLYDFKNSYLKLTKSNAKGLATDIEKSLTLLPEISNLYK